MNALNRFAWPCEGGVSSFFNLVSYVQFPNCFAMASHLFLFIYVLERPTHLPDETLAPHETISALDLADIVPMIPNPAHECIDRFALDLADVSMTRNPAYVPVQPHHRGYMTFPQDCLTEPSPASNSRPLPCPPEIEMKRKQKQMQYKILPPPLPLPVPSIVPDSDDALGVDEAVPVPLTSDTFGYPEKKVCTVLYVAPVGSGPVIV